jgi:putative membrane protein
MMWGDGWGWWWFSSWLFILLCGLGFAGFIYFIIWAIGKQGKGGRSATGSNALEITKERYAKGEISREEFEQIKKDLT